MRAPAALAALALAALAACSFLELPPGAEYACAADGDCRDGGSCFESRCVGDAGEAGDAQARPDAARARSCRELPDGGADGVATIYPPRFDGGLPVHCLSSVEGGGWTLAARTAAVAARPFGWRASSGSLGDPSRSYSLGALLLGVPFREILVASASGTSFQPGDDRYVVELPAEFPGQCEIGYCRGTVRDVSVGVGGCRGLPRDGALLESWGCLANLGLFPFRDQGLCSAVNGLGPTGFFTEAAGCDADGAGGNLHLKQGLLYVR